MKINKIISITKPTKNVKKTTSQQFSGEKLKAKEYPNWVGLPGENYGNNVGYKIAFYPEDEEKMKTMTPEEASAYEHKLFLEHKYYKDDRPIVFSEEFIQFMKEHNLELERFIVD